MRIIIKIIMIIVMIKARYCALKYVREIKKSYICFLLESSLLEGDGDLQAPHINIE